MANEERCQRSLKELALKLLKNGPHQVEKTPRRVRGLFDGSYIFDTTQAQYVWEFPYYPQFYIPMQNLKTGSLVKSEPVDDDKSAFLSLFKGPSRSTDRVLTFEKGPLAGLVRFEFAALGLYPH